MMWYRIKSFLAFYSKASTKYNVQSPFLYDFVSNVLDTSKTYYAFEKIEKERTRLKADDRSITLQDWGAGSATMKGRKRKISDIADTSLSGHTKCRILFQLVHQYRCKNILELGTSLGISSAYMASVDHKSKIITLEGDTNVAQAAIDVHRNLHLNNIDVKVGKFADTIDTALKLCSPVDLAFIDGHHEKDATIRYFYQILEKCNEQSIIVLDDIYWSKGMSEAWQTVSQHPDVTLSIDLYDIGILFFRKELSKQAVSYIPYRYKPWRIGLFGQ